jgi:hypothetical protein
MIGLHKEKRMPLSDLFKKPAKKEPPKNDPFGSPEMQKKRYDAALEFLGVLQNNFLSSEGKGHAGTTLSVAAWMSGTSLYRAIGYKQDPPPGTVMLSDEVNRAWPELMNLFLYYCQRNGIEIKADQMVLDPPAEQKPKIEIQPAQAQFQDIYNEIMKKHGLDYLDGARAGMIACSVVFHYHCTRTRDIDPNVAAGIVSMGVVAGAKTVPPPLGPGGAAGKDRVGNVKNDDRFLVGEREAVIRESQTHGGAYVDPHPQVLATLKAGGIDPYLIHEQGMVAQIEKKITRIDFVQADVNRLFDEWKTKPEANIPIHVRQILWLKKNAAARGYEQQGNSWVLK